MGWLQRREGESSQNQIVARTAAQLQFAIRVVFPNRWTSGLLLVAPNLSLLLATPPICDPTDYCTVGVNTSSRPSLSKTQSEEPHPVQAQAELRKNNSLAFFS